VVRTGLGLRRDPRQLREDPWLGSPGERETLDVVDDQDRLARPGPPTSLPGLFAA